jgi:hypothetical protein
MSKSSGSRRAAVERFADSMESALRRNDWKGKEGWKGFPRGELLRRLKEEVAELEIAMRSGGSAATRKEAADVANFAMMIAEETP